MLHARDLEEFSEEMVLSISFPANGWRRTALVNTILIVFFLLVLVILVIWSSLRAGGIDRNLVFYQGNCGVGRAHQPIPPPPAQYLLDESDCVFEFLHAGSQLAHAP